MVKLPDNSVADKTCDFLTEHSISTFKGLRNRAPGSCLVNLELLDNPGLLYHLVLNPGLLYHLVLSKSPDQLGRKMARLASCGM